MDLSPNQRIYDVLLDIHRDRYRIPNIQRGYEWDKSRIAKLLDSIMNGYPIGAIMVWKPNSKVRSDISDRSFVRDFRSDEDYLADDIHPSDPEAYLVLDGQQRLQSLYLGFFGSYDGERAYMAIDHLPSTEADDDDYDFQFLTIEEAKKRPNMVPLADVVKLNPSTKSKFVEERATYLTEMIVDDNERLRVKEEKKIKIETNIDGFIWQFNVQPAILIQEVNSEQTYDHVLEIFERVNSGGMVLNKSDLLFSTLKLKLKEMEAEFNQTLTNINHGSRYAFDTDFIIKTSLVVFGKGAKYDVKKLRDNDYINNLKDNYVVLDKCLRQLIAWLDETALIKCDRFLPSKLALIPLIDYMMLSGEHEKPDSLSSQAMKQYLYMAFFTRLFGRSGDATLDKIHKQLVLSTQGDVSSCISREGFYYPLDQLNSIFQDRTKADYSLHKHFFADNADLMLNIVQGGVLQIDQKDPKKDPKDLKLEVDHIFPRSKLKKVGMEDIADFLGNYRLIVLPKNRRKLAKCPDMTTDFSGKNDAEIASAYSNAISNFNRETYWAFVSSRVNHIQREVEKFLGLKVIPATKGR
ncbi:MAG: DUF262 domain-containing protein [Methanothrix sp.]